MRHRSAWSFAAVVGACVLPAFGLDAVAGDPPAAPPAPARLAPAGFATGDELLARLDALAKSSGAAYSSRTIGFSLEKRPINGFVFGDQDLS